MFHRLAAALRIPAILAAHGTSRPPADFSGVDEFWRLADILGAQSEPTAEAWDKLFATPGYAALEARERRRASIVLAMRAAFHPANRRLRDSLLAANGWTARVIRHVETLPPRRAELDRFAVRMRQADVVAQAARTSQQLLPPGMVERYGIPAVAFVFFLPDGRGYPALIVADLANVMKKDDPLPFFAHEATHFYWAQLSRARRAHPMQAPTIADNPQRMQALSDSASKALPLEGRPFGMYIARAIRKQLGDAGFAEVAGDPVAYVRAYQRAAQKPGCGCTPFSDAAMGAIAQLRR